MIAMNAFESDNSRALLGEHGGELEALRAELHAVAGASGYPAEALTEWCSADAPGAPAGLPPLYYAALLPGNAGTDMPLGLGESAAAALIDLLWTLGGSALLAAVRTRDLPRDEPAAPVAAPCTAEMDARGEPH